MNTLGNFYNVLNMTCKKSFENCMHDNFVTAKKCGSFMGIKKKLGNFIEQNIFNPIINAYYSILLMHVWLISYPTII